MSSYYIYTRISQLDPGQARLPSTQLLLSTCHIGRNYY